MIVSIELYQGCLNGVRTAQGEVYKVLYPELMRISLRYCSCESDAQGIVNGAMFKVFTKMKDFKGTHENFGGWVRQIVIHEAIDNLRASKSFQGKHLTVESFNEKDSDPVSLEEHPEEIFRLMEALPTNPKAVFNLYAIEGYSHKEIAEMLNITVANSKWSLHHAREQLKVWIVEKQLM